MQIYPIDREWIFTYVLEPYDQGCELINLFWNGVDRSLERNALSWGDRLIYLIEGALLLIPLINTIIWIVYQTFLKMDTLVDPFCPEAETPLPARPISAVIIHRETDQSIRPTERLGFIEQSGGTESQVNWLIETFPDMIVVEQTGPTFSSTSTYTPDYQLKSYRYEEGEKRYVFSKVDLEHGAQIVVEIVERGEAPTSAVLQLPEGAHWIQQKIIGFRPFILSNEQEMEFYGLVPEYPPLLRYSLGWRLPSPPFLTSIRARKMGLEEVPELGRQLMKVEVAPTLDQWPYNTIKSTLWFDPASGRLEKFFDTGPWIIPDKVGTCIQSNQ